MFEYLYYDYVASDKQYASFYSALDVFSSLCRYLTIESVIEKYIGNRPVSERTARFEVFLFTPKIYFKYFKWNLSAILYLYISSNIKQPVFLHAPLFVLKVPQISDPYSTIGFNK